MENILSSLVATFKTFKAQKSQNKIILQIFTKENTKNYDLKQKHFKNQTFAKIISVSLFLYAYFGRKSHPCCISEPIKCIW